MEAGRVLRECRRRAGLSQRALAERAGVPQSVVARIERGRVVPRVHTLDRLLAACGWGLEAAPRLGIGVDRTMIREFLRLTPEERFRLAAEEADVLDIPFRRAR